MFREASKTDLHKRIEELKIQLDTAHKKADVAGSDLIAELEHCKDEKSVLELKVAQYRLDQPQKSMPAKLSDSCVSETRKPKVSGVDAIYDIATGHNIGSSSASSEFHCESSAEQLK